MADSIIILSPGDRIEDANGNPVSGAKLKFTNAGTTTPKTVYSDDALTTSLGTTVYCDSGGYPVTTQGGATKTAVYTGAGNHDLEITDANDTVVVPRRTYRGASDLSVFSTATATNNEPTIAKSTNYTVVTGDGYKTIVCTQSGGSFTLTLPSAVSVGDGWWIEVFLKSASSVNTVTLATVSVQTIASSATAGTSLVLSGGGSGGKLKADGANWIFEPHQTPGSNIHTETSIASASTVDLGASTADVIEITGTATITSFGTAANRLRFVRFAGVLTLTHNGTSLILPGAVNITTAAGDTAIFASDGSGNWRCWHYSFLRGTATAAEMKTGSATNVAVTPGVMRNHDLVAKAWVRFDGSNPATIFASEGIASVSRVSAGTYDITMSTALADDDFVISGMANFAARVVSEVASVRTTSAFRVAVVVSSTAAVEDNGSVSVTVFGNAA